MNDFRIALRQYVRQRGFALTVVCTLAVTVGATTAVFSVVNTVLVRALPFSSPERLVFVDREVTLKHALKNGDRSGGKPESACRFCHALRSEAGGAFDISTRGGAKLAERSIYPREPERSWRSVRHIHERWSEAGGAFDISTRGGAKLAERSTYPQETERSWRRRRRIHET